MRLTLVQRGGLYSLRVNSLPQARMLRSNQALSSATSQSAAPCAAPTRTLLLVDDEATLRSALRRFFTRRGWRVAEAEDGERARAMLLDGETIGGGYDAVITDMRMPRLTGMELHDMVSRTDARLGRRFIFSSGDMGDDDALEFIARTQCPVIPKPFELAALLAVVERVAAGSIQRAG
jgi:DNA-binding NtrC family response regulator